MARVSLKFLLGVALASVPTHGLSTPGGTMNQLVILSQSIGRGVPADTRRTLDDIIAALRDAGLHPSLEPWGLEGEKRVCVALSDAALDTLVPKIESLIGDTPLLQVEIQRDTEDPCGLSVDSQKGESP